MSSQKPEEPEMLKPVEARQGHLGRDVLYVLPTWTSPQSPDKEKFGSFLARQRWPNPCPNTRAQPC